MQKYKFLDQLHRALLASGKAESTAKGYRLWVERFIRYHGKRHPREMGADEINAFICHIACDLGLSASAQKQALCAIKFAYDKLLHTEFGRLKNLIWAKSSQKLPSFYSAGEVTRILNYLAPPYWLMVYLDFGTGLRISELLGLTVGAIDFDRKVIRVLNGKGGKQREVGMPESLIPYLRSQVDYTSHIYAQDLSGVSFSNTVYGQTKHYKLQVPAHVRDQLLFVRNVLGVDHANHHIVRGTYSRQAVSKALKKAMLMADVKPGSFHSLRHSYATAALACGMNIRELQDSLGHNHLTTTQIYTHVLPGDRLLPPSPLDEIKLET